MNGSAPLPAIIVLADDDDVGIRRVVSHLESRYPVIWWRFGVPETTVTVDVDEGGFVLEQPGATLRSDDFRNASVVVYKRRWLQSRPLVRSGLKSQADRAFSEREWGSLVEGLLIEQERCGGPLWLNPPSAWAQTDNKLSLLLRAARLGLPVPAFRVSTPTKLPPQAGDDVVTKAISTDEEIDATRYFSTVRLLADDLAGIRDEHLPTPSFLQEYVASAKEFRSYYILGQMFTVALKPSSEHVDIRHAPVEDMAPTVDRLPEALDRALGDLAGHFGLNYCAFDLLAPAEGSPMLVDITPAGSWDYFESDDAPFVSNALGAAIEAHLTQTSASPL